ncbi:hypothetical protein C6W20_00685 [Bacillus sp. NMCN6]|nr:hypothetical protein C6W21_00680 [Bacillus sp. NMCN1]PRR99579.1 hypothetical protein C6W20_00685 [Bacillus sp. NMCN6]
MRQRHQRVDKPSHSLSDLRSGAHECSIRSTPVLVLPRLQRFSITLKEDKSRWRQRLFFIHRRKGQHGRVPLLRQALLFR